MAKKVVKKSKSVKKKTPQRQKQKEYDNNMRGVLFKNKRKKKETQPDYTGQVEIDGVQFWLSGWMNESNNGVKFMSLSLQPKDEETEDEETEDEETEDDDLPF